MQVFEEFYSQNVVLRSHNAMFLVLIPKKGEARMCKISGLLVLMGSKSPK